MNQRIVCAALRNKDNNIVCGARHFDKIMHSQINAREDRSTWRLAEQGFIDQQGNFLTRKEALEIAILEDQLLRDKDTDELYSECLY